MYFIYIEYGTALHGTVKNCGKALFEVAPVLCSSKKTREVNAIYLLVKQPFGHPTIVYHVGKTIDDGCLAHSWVSYMERVVLLHAA